MVVSCINPRHFAQELLFWQFKNIGQRNIGLRLDDFKDARPAFHQWGANILFLLEGAKHKALIGALIHLLFWTSLWPVPFWTLI